MSDPNNPPHHGDTPPEYPPSGAGAYGLPPPPPPSQPHSNQPHYEPRTYGHDQPPPPGERPVATGEPTPDEVMWGGAAHWSALLGAFVAMAFLGPLIVLLVKGNTSPYVRAQAVESLNFQISILIYAAISAVLILLLIGIPMLIAVGIGWLVLTIVGSVKSSQGELYRYPLTIRMVG